MPHRRKWSVLFGRFGGIVQTHEWCRCQLLVRINSEEKQFGSSQWTHFELSPPKPGGLEPVELL